MHLSRRNFLRAGAVSLALPWLEGLAPAFPPAAAPPRRMVCVCTPLGLHAPNFFPAASGRGFVLPPYLEVLNEFRDDVSVISGLSHPGVEVGHDSIFSFLTAAPHPERRAGFRNTVSLDQFAAEHIGERTRFPSLQLSHEGFGLSWTRTGALIPPDTSPARVFARLFLAGRPEDIRAQERRLQDNQSILDTVASQAGTLRTGLGAGDRGKLDEYFTSVRELERRMVRAEEWVARPRPVVAVPQPRDIPNSADLVGRTRLLLDLAHLALQTDSTRLITILLGGTSLVPPIPGVSFDHHNLSHHGQDPDKLTQLRRVEVETMRTVRDFLGRLKGTREEGVTLLDRTMVFFGSNLGNGNSHSCRNLPVLLAGGGFRHGQHLAFNPASPPPLCNLYVTMLQRLGIEAERFGSSTGSLTGIEVTGS